MMSEYLKEINEFWQQYLDQYNSIYDESTLKNISVKILWKFQDLRK